MQDLTLTHANTFFFVTTIAVCVGIIILLVLVFIFIRILKAIRHISQRVEKMIDKTSQHIETAGASDTVKKSLPFILSIASLFMKRKKTTKK